MSELDDILNPHNSGDTPKNGDEKSAHDRYIDSLIAENARKDAEKKALIQEFSRTISLEWSPEDLKEKLRDLGAQAYARIAQTISDDDNPALAFQAAKYVFQYLTGSQRITNDNDPDKDLKDLLARIANPKAEADVSD